MKRLHLPLLLLCNAVALNAGAVDTSKVDDIAVIDNGVLRVEISRRGAELYSIKSKVTGREYLWQGDPSYWRFRSPVLFPIVGAVYDNTLRVQGKEYNMAQHGLARHLNFELVKSEAAEVVYQLKSSAETLKSYPYDFLLQIGYRLEGDALVVSYRVENPSSETIHFQLGAHPGFNYMNYNPEAEVQGYFAFNDMADDDALTVKLINKAGFLIQTQKSLPLMGKKIAITAESFNDGALILEDEQSRDISLLDAEGRPYLRVSYDAPVVGLWSSVADGYAPFVCIEPWYGRCDRDGYKGEFKDKDLMQSLEAGDNFTTAIRVTVVSY